MARASGLPGQAQFARPFRKRSVLGGVIMLEGNRSHAKNSRSTVPACALGFAAAAIVLFQLFARSLFPPLPGGEVNPDRTLAAAVIALFAGMAGVMIGSLIDRLRR
jgi:hypothetical protein